MSRQLQMGASMKSLIEKRSIVIAGRRTSVSVEDAFWESLKKIAAHRRLTLSALVTVIDSERHYSNLSSAIRLCVLNFYRERLTEGDENKVESKLSVICPRSHPAETSDTDWIS
jgi:predicted DNA-binding ribbon-helix-helix protein